MLGILLFFSKRTPQSNLSYCLHSPAVSPTHTARQLIVSRPRRYSSSKPSSPSNGDSASIANPASPASKDVTGSSRKRSSSRPSKLKSKEFFGKATSLNLVSSLPSVPSTEHLHLQDVTLASFFSLHRPISVIAPVPPNSTDQAFSAIFASPAKSGSSESLSGLSSAVSNLSVKTGGQNTTGEMGLAVTQRYQGNTESASNASQSLYIYAEELAKNFRPFNPPPPPLPEYDTDRWHSSYRKLSLANTIHEQPPSTSISLPIMKPTHFISTPYFSRMKLRQITWKEKLDRLSTFIWRTISVRRQRRLKMKKHKFKKLLKRTRNLRRKLDKL